MEQRLENVLRAYRGASPRKRRVVFHVGYFILTAMLFFLATGILLLTKRAPIWTVDGLKQHFPYMTYIGQWLREAASALLNGQTIPTFQFALGFGADVLQSLNWYGLGDPLLLLTALFPPERMELCYILLIFLRYYLAGVAFLAYARYMKIPRRYALPGALAYAFSVYMVSQCAMRHPFFANPLIHLPLFFLGAEKALSRKSPACLILSVAWSALCGFYFLYVNSLLLLVYALFRHFGLERERPLKKLPLNAARLIGFYGVGILIAAVIFLPNVLGYLSSGRAFAGPETNLLLHGKDVYALFLPTLFTYNPLPIYPTMPAIGVFAAILLLLSQKRAHRPWKWAFFLSLIFALVPFFGSMFNGFSYVSTRWQYGALFLLCIGFSMGFPMLLNLPKRAKRLLSGAAILLTLYCLMLYVLKRIDGRERMNSALLLAAILAAVGSLIALLGLNRLKKHPAIRYVLTLALLMANLLGFHAMVEVNSILTDSLVELGGAYAQVTDSPFAMAPECGEGELWRVDASQNDSPTSNEGVLLNRPTTFVYNSLLPQSLYESALEMQNGGQTNVCRVEGLDSRAALEALWSVKYFAREVGGLRAPRVPYGFEWVKSEGKYELYENTLALPLGYTTDAYMTLETYQSLSPLEKQWALLQGAVLPEEDARYRLIEPEKSAVEVSIAVEDTDTVSWDGETLVANQEISPLHLHVAGVPDAETYVELRGYDIHGSVKASAVGLMTEDGFDFHKIPSENYNQRIPKRDFLIHAGYSESAQTEMDLYVYYAGEYDLSEIRAYCQPMEKYEEFVEALREEPLENIALEANRVSGTASLSKDKILLLSIPYMPGWSARVDGEAAELFASGTAYTALKLEAGEHEIVLTYETPGLKIGAWLSFAGLLAFAAILIIRRRRRA